MVHLYHTLFPQGSETIAKEEAERLQDPNMVPDCKEALFQTQPLLARMDSQSSDSDSTLRPNKIPTWRGEIDTKSPQTMCIMDW